MNLQQLQYIVAVDEQRHFARAAEACFVTQATLSMMIRKLEEELGVIIFDRSRKPVVPTQSGQVLLEQARTVLHEASAFTQLAEETRSGISGELRIGVIPTLAPYLLPLFLQPFLEKYPNVHVRIRELTTGQTVEQLRQDRIDVGILATPLNLKGILERPLFRERFLAFVSAREQKVKGGYILPENLDPDRLWLLEEGHCLRTQILNLCELRKQGMRHPNLEYEAGSIESLLGIVEANEGITVVPELAARQLSGGRKEQLREFHAPVPVREISLITYRHFVKKRLLEALEEEIKVAVAPHLAEADGSEHVVAI